VRGLQKAVERERVRRSITAVCWNSFYDLNEKIGKLVVIEVESTDVVESTDIVESGDVEPAGDARGSFGVARNLCVT